MSTTDMTNQHRNPTSILCLILTAFVVLPNSTAVNYGLKNRVLNAPGLLCIPGNEGHNSAGCPTDSDVLNHRYRGILMDEFGSVKVKLRRVKAIHRDDFRLHKYEVGGDIQLMDDNKRRGKEANKDKQTMHKLQFFLVPLSELRRTLNQTCCFEKYSEAMRNSLNEEFWKQKTITKKSVESVVGNLKYGQCKRRPEQYASTKQHMTFDTDFDYMDEMPRIGRNVHVSDPLPVFDENEDIPPRKQQYFDISFTVFPLTKEQHVLVISNCAANVQLRVDIESEQNTHQTNGKAFTFEIGSIEMAHASKFGELPLSMMGIIPFYASLVFAYGFLATMWFRRSEQQIVITPLQIIIRSLVYMQLVFCCVAFSYYIHLNRQPVDVDVLYSGTAAALINWSPWSIAVALGHFSTILACQIVVTLVADGTWLIQKNVRSSTRRVLYVLCGAWLVFFIMYGFVKPLTRQIYFAVCGFLWISLVLILVVKSLQHIKSLIQGACNENIVAGGGILIAKRSMFRKMLFAIAIYPIVFSATIIWKIMAKHDAWAWIGFILGDLYLFVMLVHASITWMPQTLASAERAKYSPLDSADLVFDDDDGSIWGGDMEFDMDMDVELTFQGDESSKTIT